MHNPTPLDVTGARPVPSPGSSPCPACAVAPASTAPCFVCGRIAGERGSPRALQLAAVDGLASDLRRRPHLPDDLRQDLLGRVEHTRLALTPAAAPVATPVATPVAIPVAAPVARPVAIAPATTVGASAPPEPAAPVPRPPPRPILPDWLSRLGPAAAENLMYLLGGFLVVAGAVYFASTAWTTMTGTQRLLLLDGGLLALGALLIGVGRLLTKSFAAEPAGQRIRHITAHIGAGLGPLACIIAGRAALDAPFMGIAALAVLGAGTVGARRLADGPGRARDALATLAICLAAAAAPLLGPWPIAAALAGGALVGTIARFGPIEPRAADIAHLTGAAFALAAHIILCTGVFGAGTVTLAALAAGLIGHVTGRSGRLAVLALALVAVGPAFTVPDLLPVVCLLATWTAGRVALSLDRAPLFALPLFGSLLTYVTAPAPLRELVEALKAAFSASMGYGSEPLPLAWYGLTCLPYLLGLAWVARRLRARPPMARMATGWLLLVTVGLCGLALVSDDPRAPMAVLAADGAVMLAIGLFLRHRAFIILAPLALIGAGLAAANWMHIGPAGGLLLLEGIVALTLVIGVPLAHRRGLHRPLLWAAGLPLIAGGLALVALPAEALTLPALAVLLPGVALRARYTQNPGWAVLFAALGLGLVAPAMALLGGGPTAVEVTGAAFVLALAEAARALRRRPRRVGGPRAVLPVGLTAVSVIWLGLVSVGPPHPLTGALLALVWVHAAWRLRIRGAAPIAVGLLAAAAGWALMWMAPDVPRRWIPLGPGAVGLAAVLLARRGSPWIRRVRTGLVEAGAICATLAALVAFDSALSGGPATALVALAMLFTACVAAPSSRSTRLLHGLGLLLPLAAAAAIGDLYGALIAPALYGALTALRAVGRPLLPTMDRASAAFLLATALPLGAVLALDGVLHAPAPASLGLGLLIGLSAPVVRRHPRAGTAVTLTLGLLLLWGPLALRMWAIPDDLLPLLWPATGLAIALGAHRIGLHRGTARAIAGLVAAGLGAVQIPWIVHGIAGLAHPLPLGLSPVALTAFAAMWAGLTLAVLPDRLRRPAAGLVAIPLVILWPLASGLMQPGAAPALELAALSLLVGGRSVSLILATMALVACGDVRSPLFALTLTAMVALPLRATGRADRALGVELTIYAAFAAATAWLIALVPSSGRGPAEILPIIGLIAALIAAVVEWIGPRAADRLPAGDVRQSMRARIVRPVLILSALAVGLLVANTGLMSDRMAPSIVVSAGLLAAALLLATAVHFARRTGQRAAVDATLLIVALAHAFAALRSPLLDPLDGLHVLLWAAAAPALRFVGGIGELTVRLRARALLLPVPALIVTLPDHGESAIACLLAAITWGLAARQSGRPVFTGLGLALLLAAACRMGLSMDIIDPAFYGLPAGLALIVGAWIERETLSQRSMEVLQVAGIVIADLSVAVQVVRLEHPAHALLLFGLGLASVAVGWIRKRGDLMVVGAIAVVVDVTLHLLRTGFARGFLAAALLIGAGAVVLVVAGHHTRRRARR